jgi:CubicO group peptidase (beta-lactamase class C family)
VLPKLSLPISANPAPLPKSRNHFSSYELHYQFNGENKTLRKFIREAKVSSLLVLKDGMIAYEYNAFPYTRWSKHQSWSVEKSILSALIGIAVEEGSISSIEDPMDTYEPKLAENGYAGVTFRQALQMSSGIR